MTVRNWFSRKACLAFSFLLLCSTPALGSQFIGTYCVDVSAPEPARVMELAISSVADGHYIVNGTRLKSSPNANFGAAHGSAATVENELTMAVEASYTVGGTLNVTSYQFNLDAVTLQGTYQSISHESINGTSMPVDHDSGEAALVDCGADMTEFSGNTPPTDICVDCDNDGYILTSDCNDYDASIHVGAVEICGDGIDQDCDGVDLSCGGDDNGGGDNGGDDNGIDNDADGYTLAEGDCNDNNSQINPGAEEICGDNIDQDCSGADQICTQPGYQDNGVTVTDLGTGLIWQKRDDDTPQSWFKAETYCEDLTLSNATDWRLPSRSELEALIDLDEQPTIDPVFLDPEAAAYWTDTSYDANGNYKYVIHFGTGVTSISPKQSLNNFVRCVR